MRARAAGIAAEQDRAPDLAPLEPHVIIGAVLGLGLSATRVNPNASFKIFTPALAPMRVAPAATIFSSVARSLTPPDASRRRSADGRAHQHTSSTVARPC